jgi:hypothetical protein
VVLLRKSNPQIHNLKTAVEHGVRLNENWKVLMKFIDRDKCNWKSLQSISNVTFECGFCGTYVSSDRGYAICEHRDASGKQIAGGIYICSNCQGPSFLDLQNNRYPSSSFGNSVKHVPSDLEALYNEARRCTSQNCHTASVLLCRKLLMNIAVNQGAKEGLRFIEYVNYLSDSGYTPPNGKHWVDHIRKKGNEATHEIALMNEADSKELIAFTEMLLKFIYEFPAIVPHAP